MGSDLLPVIIKKMVKRLEKTGIKIASNSDVENIKKEGNVFIIETKDKVYESKYLLVAPGRGGTKWLQGQASTLKISYEYQMVEVGVRFEFPASVTEDHNKIMYEGIYSIQTPTFDDTMRTFAK